MTIDVVVETGVVDVGDRYSFFTPVSGAGVVGDAGAGTDRNVFVRGTATRSPSVMGGTDATIDPWTCWSEPTDSGR